MKKPESPENVFEPMPGTGAEPEKLIDQPDHTGLQAADLAGARKNMTAGMLWCAAGLAVTFLTYCFTEEGGRYVVATGAIIWGFLQACGGLYTWLKINYVHGRYAAFWRMTAAAACVAGILCWAGAHAIRPDEGDSAEYLDTEQTYLCDELNLRLTVPPGYSAYTLTYSPETDNDYAIYTMATFDRTWAYRVELLADVFGPEDTLTDFSEHFFRQASSYFDDQIIARPFLTAVGKHAMFCSSGRKSDVEGFIYTVYNARYGQSLLTITFAYPEAEYDKAATHKRIGELIGRIESVTPETAVE